MAGSVAMWALAHKAVSAGEFLESARLLSLRPRGLTGE